MSGIDQATRAVRIFSPLPDNTLALSCMEGSEQISELFHYSLECVSEDASIELYDVLGQNICIEFDTDSDGTRNIHGLINQAAHVGSRGEYALYRLSVTAWPWMLKQTTDCRIFAEMTVPEIIASVLDDNGFSDYDARLMGNYDVWNFCVQYQESDFDFISRLMEHEGIYYFFEHFDDRHVMVLCDGPTAHSAAPNYSEIPYYPEGLDQSRITDHLINWQFEKTVRSGAYATKDFAFDQPRRDLLVQSSESLAGNYESKEVYDFPGGYSYQSSGEMTRSYGERLAKARMEAVTAKHEIASAVGNVRGLNAGNLFNLTECEREDQNREYLVLYAALEVQMDSYYSGTGGGAVELKSSFRCMPSSTPFKPERKTAKPEIRGPQTAIVVGAAGEEIWTDEHGRVKLQFHWDRYGQSDENSSCWVRVSQAWAGEKWGSIHIPRIGQEVIVEYVDGDPDRPIVTGRVYNGDRPVPYDLPANATQSGIKSRSSKNGTPANFNEIRMEDKKGSEEIYIHAEKNQTNIVENDEYTSVGHDRKEEIGNDETISIGNNRREDVGNDESIRIGHDRAENVGNDETIDIGSNRVETVGKNETITVGSNRKESVGSNETINVGSNRTEKVGKNESISIGDDRTEKVGKNESITIGDDRTEKVGKNEEISIGKDRSLSVGDDYSLDVGKKISINAGDEIVLSTGKASITMKKDGTIVISGKDINIKASGAFSGKASKNIVLKGKKILQN